MQRTTEPVQIGTNARMDCVPRPASTPREASHAHATPATLSTATSGRAPPALAQASPTALNVDFLVTAMGEARTAIL